MNLNNNFKVTTGGKLYAKDAEISGKIVSNSNGNRIVIDPDSRTFKMLSGENYALVDLSFYNDSALMKFKATEDMVHNINQVTISPSLIDLSYSSYYVNLGATSTTFRTLSMLIDLTAHAGEVSAPKLYIKGLPKLNNTDGWDRLLVNVATGQVAYG